MEENIKTLSYEQFLEDYSRFYNEEFDYDTQDNFWDFSKIVENLYNLLIADYYIDIDDGIVDIYFL